MNKRNIRVGTEWGEARLVNGLWSFYPDHGCGCAICLFIDHGMTPEQIVEESIKATGRRPYGEIHEVYFPKFQFEEDVIKFARYLNDQVFDGDTYPCVDCGGDIVEGARCWSCEMGQDW